MKKNIPELTKLKINFFINKFISLTFSLLLLTISALLVRNIFDKTFLLTFEQKRYLMMYASFFGLMSLFFENLCEFAKKQIDKMNKK